MEIKTYLRQICKLEQTKKETEMAIPKHKAKKEESQKKIEEKRKELEVDIAKQQDRISNLSSLLKKRSNFVFEGTRKEKKRTAIVCIITAIIQAIITAIVVALFGVNNFSAATVTYTIIFAAIIAFWLYLVYCDEFVFPFFKTILGIVILAVLYQTTHWYFKTCNGIGINVIGANIISTLLIVGIEICFGIRACQKQIYAQNKAYRENKKWLHDAEIKLGQLQNELKLKKQNLANFNKDSSMALSKMCAEITALEKFLDTTKKNLQDLYAQNVLHPNYQHWVAAATIYEYLDVGRCYELKGPDGAYNLYEKELLEKRILDSLSSINNTIDRHGSNISNSQWYIRSQLSECNRNVEKIVINTYGF